MVVEEAQRQGEAARIRAVEARAAEHHVDPEMEDVGPDAVPEQLDRALVPIGLQHAGAAEFEEVEARMGVDDRLDVVFARRVEAPVPVGDLLAQQPVGAHDLRFRLAEGLRLHVVIDDEQVIADEIVFVDVPPGEQGGAVGHGRHLLVEHLEPETLRPPDLRLGGGEPDLERAEPAERRTEAAVMADDLLSYREEPDRAALGRAGSGKTCARELERHRNLFGKRAGCDSRIRTTPRPKHRASTVV